MTWVELARVILKDHSLKHVPTEDLRSLASDLDRIIRARGAS